MKRIVGRLLQRVVVAVRGGGGFRIVDRVLAKACLERLGGCVRAHVTLQRRPSRRIVLPYTTLFRYVRIGARVMVQLAGIGAAVISQLGAGRFDSVNLT